MVLEFINIVTLTGGSKELRGQCLDDLSDCGTFLCHRVPKEEGSITINMETEYEPLDNALLDLAAKYLALDFTVVFKPKSDTFLKDWRGSISIVEQNIFFSDNYEASGGYKLGSIYDVINKGGFSECILNFQT